jgi:hypothetical protein
MTKAQVGVDIQRHAPYGPARLNVRGGSLRTLFFAFPKARKQAQLHKKPAAG